MQAMRTTNGTTKASGTAPRGPGADRKSLSSPLTLILVALFALQLLLALALGLSGRDFGAASAGEPLLAFEQDQVTGIRIETPDQDPVVIAKADGGWHIPALGDFPAAELKVTDLLGKLAQLQRRLPVATTEAALTRFKVADDAHERKVTLEGDGNVLATLYLGDSPGFRRLFVRAADDPAVYEAELSLFEASDKASDWSDWSDKTILRLATQDIQRVELPGATLERSDTSWKLADLAEGEEIDQEAVTDSLRKLADLDFLTVAGTEDKPDYKQDAPVLEYRIALTSGETIEYRLSKPEEGGDYLLKVSNRPHFFRLSQYIGEDLTGITRDALLGRTDTREGVEEEAAAAQQPPQAPVPASEDVLVSPAPSGTDTAIREAAPPAEAATSDVPAAAPDTQAPTQSAPGTETTPVPAPVQMPSEVERPSAE